MYFIIERMHTKAVLMKRYCLKKEQQNFQFGFGTSSSSQLFGNWVLTQETAAARMLPRPFKLQCGNLILKSVNNGNECPWSSGTFGFVGSSGFEYAVVLSYASGGVGGEPDVGFEGMVWVEGAEEVAVKVFGGGWIFFIVVVVG